MEKIREAFVPMLVKSINTFFYAPMYYKRSSKRGGKRSPFNYRYISYYRKWKKALSLLFPCQQNKPDYKVKLVIKMQKKRRLYDQQNFIGGAKPIPDILVKLNYIRDDTPKWIEIEYHQELIRSKDKDKQEGTYIVLYKMIEEKHEK